MCLWWKALWKGSKGPGLRLLCFVFFDAPDFKTEEYFAFKVLDSVLGDGMTSKLFKELRERKGYAYAVYSTYPTRLSSPRLMAYIGTSPEKERGCPKGYGGSGAKGWYKP